MKQSLLIGRTDDLLRELRSMGLSVFTGERELIRHYLDSRHLMFNVQHPEDFWECIDTVGWYGDHESFVLPSQVLGKKTGVCFIGNGETAQYSSKGDLSEWHENVAKYAPDNPYLVFALACALTGPLLEPLNLPGAGFHYFGDSTTGKSSALTIGASVWGPPKLLSWNSTINALESQAASRSNTLIPLDESHLVDPKHLDCGIYLLLNGVSKGRMNRDGSSRKSRSWRSSILSSGERSLETHLVTAKIQYKAGQGVRIIDTPVSGKYGLFDDLHGVNSGAGFADMLRDNAAECYGVAGRTFVLHLIDKLPGLSLGVKLNKALEKLDPGIKAGGNSTLNAQETRVARSFALAAVAGELAIEWGVLPFKKDEAQTAAEKLFTNWRNAQPKSAESRESGQILGQIRDFIEKHGDSRFSDIATGTRGYVSRTGAVVQEPNASIPNRAGYWEEINGNRMFLFTSQGLHEATQGFDFNRALKALADAEAIYGSDPNKLAKTRWVPDNRSVKLYCINPLKLEPSNP